ncbi:hypothetical protein NP493_4165g00002 [Ridgeia piscesae]|uniref:Uncharacterized protein n=1 Tax=Ridgeia piscesae TaxID=27915 RepID=A0AAD9J0Y2_RIDPI|nr:hypothetical protein NP493_4165g00002 [Ridgeia piscesae]
MTQAIFVVFFIEGGQSANLGNVVKPSVGFQRTAAALLAPVALTSMSPDGYDSLTSNAFMSLCDPSLSPDSLFVQSHRGAAGDTNNVTSDLGPCSDRGDILADQNGL